VGDIILLEKNQQTDFDLLILDASIDKIFTDQRLRYGTTQWKKHKIMPLTFSNFNFIKPQSTAAPTLKTTTLSTESSSMGS
jgi:hypothetical protein